jgi:hypothetical protein
MIECAQPVITEYDGPISSVEVMYMMDFKYFGYDEPKIDAGGYPLEAYMLFAQHAHDIKIHEIPVTFNGYHL